MLLSHYFVLVCEIVSLLCIVHGVKFSFVVLILVVVNNQSCCEETLTINRVVSKPCCALFVHDSFINGNYPLCIGHCSSTIRSGFFMYWSDLIVLRVHAS